MLLLDRGWVQREPGVYHALTGTLWFLRSIVHSHSWKCQISLHTRRGLKMTRFRPLAACLCSFSANLAACFTCFQETRRCRVVFNSSNVRHLLHASPHAFDVFAMRALSRILVGGLILATLVWLKGQFVKLHQSILELDRLSQDGGLLSHIHSNGSNGSNNSVEDPLRAVMNAINHSFLNGTIEKLATPKSGLRDTRSKVVVVVKTAKERTQWVKSMLPK